MLLSFLYCIVYIFLYFWRENQKNLLLQEKETNGLTATILNRKTLKSRHISGEKTPNNPVTADPRQAIDYFYEISPTCADEVNCGNLLKKKASVKYLSIA